MSDKNAVRLAFEAWMAAEEEAGRQMGIAHEKEVRETERETPLHLPDCEQRLQEGYGQ